MGCGLLKNKWNARFLASCRQKPRAGIESDNDVALLNGRLSDGILEAFIAPMNRPLRLPSPAKGEECPQFIEGDDPQFIAGNAFDNPAREKPSQGLRSQPRSGKFSAEREPGPELSQQTVPFELLG